MSAETLLLRRAAEAIRFNWPVHEERAFEHAVADWLEVVAQAAADESGLPSFVTHHAENIARAYLGGDA